MHFQESRCQLLVQLVPLSWLQKSHFAQFLEGGCALWPGRSSIETAQVIPMNFERDFLIAHAHSYVTILALHQCWMDFLTRWAPLICWPVSVPSCFETANVTAAALLCSSNTSGQNQPRTPTTQPVWAKRSAHILIAFATSQLRQWYVNAEFWLGSRSNYSELDG